MGRCLMVQEELYGLELDQYLPVGFLKVHATMGQQTLPVAGSYVEVSRILSNGERRVYFEGETDEDGVLDGVALPTHNSLDFKWENRDESTANVLQSKSSLKIKEKGLSTQKACSQATNQ